MGAGVRFFDALIRLGGRVPLSVLHGCGRLLARVVALCGTREYRVARRNVELAFPELAAPVARRFLRETLAQTGMGMLELGAIWGRAPRSALALVREVHGREHLDAALARGRGVIVAAPHLGAWELLNLYLATVAPLTILYRVPQRAQFEALLVRTRTVLGAEALRAEPAGVRQLFRRLREGRLVGILPDQRPKGGEGVDAPFYGHAVRTMTLVSRLAHRAGARIVFGFAERLPRAAGFRIHFLPAPEGIDSEDLVQAASALNAGIEACTRIAPEQYQWTYKRFSYREKGSGPDRIYGR